MRIAALGPLPFLLMYFSSTVGVRVMFVEHEPILMSSPNEPLTARIWCYQGLESAISQSRK